MQVTLLHLTALVLEKCIEKWGAEELESALKEYQFIRLETFEHEFHIFSFFIIIGCVVYLFTTTFIGYSILFVFQVIVEEGLLGNFPFAIFKDTS